MKTAIIGLCTLALALGACRSTPVPQELSYAGNESVYVTSPDLAESLLFSPTPTVDRAREPMEVAIACESLGRERYILDYRFVWFDDRGVEIPPHMGWREIIFEPGQTRNFQAQATSRRATGWKLEVRWANR